MQGVFNPNILIYHPPNSAEGLHFSAFHCRGRKERERERGKEERRLTHCVYDKVQLSTVDHHCDIIL